VRGRVAAVDTSDTHANDKQGHARGGSTGSGLRRHKRSWSYLCARSVHLLLRNVLRDPEVFNKHTEPEVGAAFMVCDKFSRMDKLDNWADAVYERCPMKWLSWVRSEKETLKPPGVPRTEAGYP